MFWKVVLPITVMGLGAYYTCLGLIGPETRRQLTLERDAKTYLQRALPKILNGFRYAEWRKRASFEHFEATDITAWKRELGMHWKMMGPFVEMEEPIGNAGVDDIRGRLIPWGAYTARVRFRRGYGDVDVRIVKREGGWKFVKFNIRSDASPLLNEFVPERL